MWKYLVFAVPEQVILAIRVRVRVRVRVRLRVRARQNLVPTINGINYSWVISADGFNSGYGPTYGAVHFPR